MGQGGGSPSSRKAGIEILNHGSRTYLLLSPSSRKAGIEIVGPSIGYLLCQVAFLTEGGD